MNCSNCRHANKSGNENYVFCTFWQTKCNKSGMSEEDFVRKELFTQTTIHRVGFGWGYPNKHFKADTHWVHKGTASEGVMWNNQICIHINEDCQYHELIQSAH